MGHFTSALCAFKYIFLITIAYFSLSALHSRTLTCNWALLVCYRISLLPPPLCVCLSLCDLTVKSSNSGRVSLRWRLERARGGVEGGSRNSLSSWSVLTKHGTSPTKAWASLFVIALENPRPCRERLTLMLRMLWHREINYHIYTSLGKQIAFRVLKHHRKYFH